MSRLCLSWCTALGDADIACLSQLSGLAVLTLSCTKVGFVLRACFVLFTFYGLGFGLLTCLLVLLCALRFALCALCFVLCAFCFALCALCFVLCALCFVLCAL